ncbi:MAG TPA: cytochrome c oxidase assembly protein [Gemmatimonadales bacterium]
MNAWVVFAAFAVVAGTWTVVWIWIVTHARSPAPTKAGEEFDFAGARRILLPLLCAAEHLSFVVAYMLYWWPLLGIDLAERSNAFRAFYLLAGTTTGGLLGALLTFAPGAWYSHYNATTGAAGLSPLADQHLAGVVMWLIGAVPLALIGVVVLGDEG